MTAKRVLSMFQNRGAEMRARLTDADRRIFKSEYQAILDLLPHNEVVGNEALKQIGVLMSRFDAISDIWLDQVMVGGAGRRLESQHDALGDEEEELGTVQQFKSTLAFFEDNPETPQEQETGAEDNSNADDQQSSAS